MKTENCKTSTSKCGKHNGFPYSMLKSYLYYLLSFYAEKAALIHKFPSFYLFFPRKLD